MGMAAQQGARGAAASGGEAARLSPAADAEVARGGPAGAAGAPSGPSARPRAGRLRAIDALRGFSVVSMVAFHLCYDLVFIAGVSLPWFASPLRDLWRASISWVFLLVAGLMCSWSRNNLRRAATYLAVALGIWLATSVVAVDVPISFGIIYCMGVSTLLAWALGRAGLLPERARSCALAAALFAAAFLVCLDVPSGGLGLGWAGGPSLALPRALYGTGALSWLGFPGAGFASGDYYPPLPYALLYCSGACLGRWLVRTGTPAWLARAGCAPLEWLGRHALVIYVAHQPVLLGLCWLLWGG